VAPGGLRASGDADIEETWSGYPEKREKKENSLVPSGCVMLPVDVILRRSGARYPEKREKKGNPRYQPGISHNMTGITLLLRR